MNALGEWVRAHAGLFPLVALAFLAVVRPPRWRWPDFVFHRWSYTSPYANSYKAARILNYRLRGVPWAVSAYPEEWQDQWTVRLGVRESYEVDWGQIPMHVGPVYVRAVPYTPIPDPVTRGGL